MKTVLKAVIFFGTVWSCQIESDKYFNIEPTRPKANLFLLNCVRLEINSCVLAFWNKEESNLFRIYNEKWQQNCESDFLTFTLHSGRDCRPDLRKYYKWLHNTWYHRLIKSDCLWSPRHRHSLLNAKGIQLFNLRL